MVSHQNHMVIALLDSFDQALPFIHQSQWLFLHFSSIWIATSDLTSDGLSKTSESLVGRRQMSYQPLEDSGVRWAINDQAIASHHVTYYHCLERLKRLHLARGSVEM